MSALGDYDVFNSNEYDDDAFLEATNELQRNLPVMVDKLWAAGASSKNIADELSNAMQQSSLPEGDKVYVRLEARG